MAETRQYSRAGSSQRKYINEFHRFEVWCDKARLSDLPASPETVERYCAAVLMSKDNPSPGPVLNVIPAIAKFRVIGGLRNPCDDQPLREFVTAVRRRYGRPAVQREPLTLCIARGLQRHNLSAGLSRGSPWDWVIGWGTSSGSPGVTRRARPCRGRAQLQGR